MRAGGLGRGGAFVPGRAAARAGLAACLASLAVLTGLPAAPVLAEPDSRGEAETAALVAAQQEYDEALQTLQGIGAQLEQTQLAVHQTELQLTDLRSDISDTRDGIDDTTSELDLAQAALAAYLQISYKSGSLSILDVLMSAVDFNDFVTRSYYVAAVQNSQVQTINDIKDLKARLERQEEVLSGQEEEEAALLGQLQEQEAELSAQKEEADAVVAGLSEEVQELFAAQQSELTAAAEARALAASASEAGEAIGVYTPGVSQGSVVENAYACLGIPYVWGGDDESFATDGGYDCSGFVQHCYALEGYTIGRTTWDQIAQIQEAGNWKTSLDELEPGDLVFPSDSHVGVYIGNGQMIDAPFPGVYVRIDDVTNFIGGGSPV